MSADAPLVAAATGAASPLFPLASLQLPQAATKVRRKPSTKPKARKGKDATFANVAAVKSKAKPNPRKNKRKEAEETAPDEQEEGGVGKEEKEEEETGASSMTGSQLALADEFQEKTQHEHILERPDSYVGSVVPDDQEEWIYDPATQHMNRRTVNMVSGLIHIVDELLVNVGDRKYIDPSVSKLQVTVEADPDDPTKGSIVVYNNGLGLPVCLHPKLHDTFIPEMVFGRLLTGSNFSRKGNKKLKTGGKNGYGAKLANIFSTEFMVETGDAYQPSEAEMREQAQDEASAVSGYDANKYRGHKQYRQTWSDNMRAKGPRKIKKYKPKTGFTRISIKPDWVRFGTGFSQTLIDLVRTRVVDIAGTTPRSLKVEFNGQEIPVKCFKDLVAAYMGGGDSSFVYECCNEDWEVAVATSTSGFRQVSFVNGIRTTHGGTHVNDVVKNVRKALLVAVNKQSKRFQLNEKHVQNHLLVFVNCRVVEPAFDSQTKERLNSPVSKFGSTYELSENFYKRVLKQTNLTDLVLRVVDGAMAKDMKKQDKGNRLCRMRLHPPIEKLDDANWAGGGRSSQCTLILTEGDSAKALAISGLSVVGRDKYGVFPLKGKLLNVREASHDQIMKNVEITSLKRILGLQQGVVYKDTKSMRYGRVMVMTDQDHDGSHIKGLLINLFATFWPELYRLGGFLVEFITPIVRRTLTSSRGKTFVNYYTIPEYKTWVDETPRAEQTKWQVKYYKGLGTSTSADAKRYFSSLSRHLIPFYYSGPEDDAAIDLAFNSKLANARKEWISAFVEGTFLDQNVEKISFSDFVNRELILFSIASNERAIPSLLDGLKPGQRKIMYGAFLKKLRSEIKLEQLAGFVSEKGAYHHAEKSLHETIIKLAHDFVGSNNLNLLLPLGQFGTRLEGGKDHASPRYIFTQLATLAWLLFPNRDQPLLKYQVEEGQTIEPEAYVPIIPLVLVNGCHGIGTGWSSDVPNFGVADLVERLRHRLLEKATVLDPLVPSFRDFIGTVTKLDSKAHRYNTRGHMTYNPERGELHVKELPVGAWTSVYKLWLEKELEKEHILEFKEYHTDIVVSFVVRVTDKDRAVLDAAYASAEGAAEVPASIYKKFKCTGCITTSNMVLFDARGKIHKYESAEEIIDAYFPVRLDLFERRRLHELQELELTKQRTGARIRFIEELLTEPPTLELRRKARRDIDAELKAKDYPVFDDGKPNYGYLLTDMPMSSVSLEKVAKLRAENTEADLEHTALLTTNASRMWLEELDAFMLAHKEWEVERKVAVTAAFAKEEEEEKDNKGKGKRKKKEVKGKNKQSGGAALHFVSPLTAAAAPTKKKSPNNRGGGTKTTTKAGAKLKLKKVSATSAGEKVTTKTKPVEVKAKNNISSSVLPPIQAFVSTAPKLKPRVPAAAVGVNGGISAFFKPTSPTSTSTTTTNE